MEQADNAVSPDFPAGDCTFTAEGGTLSVKVRADGMEACLLAVTPAGKGVVFDAGKITSVLRANHIVYGILTENIALVSAEVDGVKGWSGREVVAEGRPPGIPGRLVYTAFGPDVEVTVASAESWKINDKVLHFGPLSNYFQQNREPGPEPDFHVKAVAAGEVVAIRQPPLEGNPGRDIFGREIKAPEFCELFGGQNINLVRMRQFTANLYGYMFVTNRRLAIFSPIIVADDDMTAWFVNLPQISPIRHPCPADICQALEAAGVTHGILDNDIAELCKALEKGDAPVWNVVARGALAEPGQDGYMEFGADRQRVAGKMRPDGSMDMRELNRVQTADDEEFIAVLHPPTAGYQGYTLSGVVLETTPGNELKVEAKDNIRVEDDGDGTLSFFAEQPGLIVYQNQKITIEPLYLIKGNVDFSTGNIDVDCNLQINGSICSDFVVKTTKNVLVAGAIEPGAKLFVEGDLEVKGGILGEDTEVRVLGDIHAEFVQGAKVVAKGEIHVRQYIYVASVRSIGAIVVGPGSGKRGGSIAGGTVCSTTTITAKSCGSPSNVPTTLELQPHPKKLAVLKDLKRAIKKCHAHLKMIKSTLKLETLDLEELQTLFEDIGQDNGNAKAVYAKLLRDVKNNLDKIEELNAAKNIVKQKIFADAAFMRVSISQHCYGNTLVRICGKELLDKNDWGATSFVYRENSVQVDIDGGNSSPGEDLET